MKDYPNNIVKIMREHEGLSSNDEGIPKHISNEMPILEGIPHRVGAELEIFILW